MAARPRRPWLAVMAMIRLQVMGCDGSGKIWLIDPALVAPPGHGWHGIAPQRWLNHGNLDKLHDGVA